MSLDITPMWLTVKEELTDYLYNRRQVDGEESIK
jgi:hypothetical protein